MILRISKAHVKSGKENEFERFIQEKALPFMKNQAGLRDVFTAWSKTSRSPVFIFATLWDSLEDVKRFAGTKWTESVVLPGEAHMVDAMTCEHFETLKAK